MEQSEQNPFLVSRVTCISYYRCNAYPNYGYYLYVPKSFGTAQQPQQYALTVIVPGVDRNAETYRNLSKPYAEQNQSVLICPIFPAELGAWLGTYRLADNEHPCIEGLLAMIDEVAQHIPIEKEKFLLHGFSCGAQFAHRFFYLYPERLRCVSIGAPGDVTLLNAEKQWPEGTGGSEAIFGRAVIPEKLRKIPVQIVVGSLDDGRLGGEENPDRLTLSRNLHAAFEAHGVAAEHIIVDNVPHYGIKVLDPVFTFLSRYTKI